MLIPSLLLVATLPGATAPALPPPPASESLEDRVVEHRLANGWTLLIVPRDGAPVVSFETYIGVGSVNEHPGITGMAHMFEHMAFKGSDRIGTRDWPREQAALARLEAAHTAYSNALETGEDVERLRTAFEKAQADAATLVEPEEFSALLEDAGGSASLNASTSADETRYTVSLPSNCVELWAWMERERFGRPVLREFYKERDVVGEERNMRVDSSPGGTTWEALISTAFREHPYRIPTIGWREDIERLRRTEAEEFFATHYAPRRFVTTIVGDVDPERVIELLERYLGDLPPGPEPAPIGPPEPEQTEERRTQVEFPAEPILAMGWRVPALDHPDTAAVEVAMRLLGWSRSSRLERRLIWEDGIALQVQVGLGWPGNRHPNLAGLFAFPTAGVTLEQLEAAIDEEIERLAAEGPGPEELAGVLRVARAETLRAMQGDAELAAWLGEWHAKTGDWRRFFRRGEELEAVGPADVQRALRTYFVPTGRTLVQLVPPADASEPQPETDEENR
jgi:predicted Zn-dependent peptidase